MATDRVTSLQAQLRELRAQKKQYDELDTMLVENPKTLTKPVMVPPSALIPPTFSGGSLFSGASLVAMITQARAPRPTRTNPHPPKPHKHTAPNPPKRALTSRDLP